MEDVNNHNQQYSENDILLLGKFTGNIPDMTTMNDDHCMILIAHRVRSIIISKSLNKSHKIYKKYENATNKIIHYMDYKKSTSHKLIPDDSKKILLELFENDHFYSYCNL